LCDVILSQTAGWLSRQVTAAFPWNTAPRYLLRDRDASYGRYFQPGRGDGDHESHYGAAFCQGEDR
jgi:hypothetical protein